MLLIVAMQKKKIDIHMTLKGLLRLMLLLCRICHLDLCHELYKQILFVFSNICNNCFKSNHLFFDLLDNTKKTFMTYDISALILAKMEKLLKIW